MRTKFNLPRQEIPEKMLKPLLREIKKQKTDVRRLTVRQLRELKQVCEQIEKQEIPENLACQKLPKKLGMGIFLKPDAKPILKGTIIVPYSGIISLTPQNATFGDSAYAFAPMLDIRLTKEEQALFDPKNKFHPRRLYTLDVDAEKKGNFARFINHSDKPNVVAHLFKTPKNHLGLSPMPLEVIYVAKKKILPGEQLLVCYEGEGSTYWKYLNIKPFPMTPQTFTYPIYQKSKF